MARVAAASVKVTASTTVDGVGNWDMFLAESVHLHQPQPIFKIADQLRYDEGEKNDSARARTGDLLCVRQMR